MEKRLRNSEWPRTRNRTRDEEEIYSISYDDTSDLHPISDISSFIKLPHRVRSSKENVELSLEVEIADSLKRLIASPHKNDSALLDVTIVRPSDLDSLRGGLDAGNTLAFKNSEVRNLIASMERQKQHKKRLIEECRRKVASPKMIAISETQDVKSNNDSERIIFSNQDDHKPSLQKRRLKRSENTKHSRSNIAVMSAPTKPNARVDILGNFTNNTESFDYKEGQRYRNSAPMAFLKPIVGNKKQSLNNLGVSVSQVGDHQSVENVTKRQNKYIPLSSTSDSNISNTFMPFSRDKRHLCGLNKKDQTPTHQIYAAANNYDKLRNLLTCQNSERNNQENEKPCMCQHCGMIGLLVESQKRPIVPIPVKKPESTRPKNGNPTTKEHNDNEFARKIRKESESRHNTTDLKTKCGGDHYWVIHELSSRLEALEARITAQEQRAVPKDYFKRIINKILHRQNISAQRMSQLDRDAQAQVVDRSTQYNPDSFENLPQNKREPSKIIKHRNVQIQQNTRKSYCVNPVLINQTESEPSPSNESHEYIAEPSKKVGTTAMSAISDFFTKKSDSSKKISEADTSKGKNNPIESFWRWGEEIIKPGFDLKIKIMSLLDEQFANGKQPKPTDSVSLCSKKTKIKTEKPKSDLPQAKSFRNSTTSPVNLFNPPATFQDDAISSNVEQDRNDEKSSFQASSSQTFKNMLHFMSEKIYNDHVKPTVDAIKQEQKSFNSENTKQIYNIKAAMDAALSKVNTKEIHTLNTTCKNESLPLTTRKEWRKDFLEPLEIPASIKRTELESSTTSRLIKKSGIPVRVSNASPADSVIAGNSKFKEDKQSLIPRWKSPSKSFSVKPSPPDNESSPVQNKPSEKVRKVQKEENHEEPQKKTAFKKLSTRHQHVTNNTKSTKHGKLVHIKYINPKAGTWNEESCASVLEQSSEENNQVMLTDNCNRRFHKYENLRENHREDKRRISQKHSVTGTATSS